MICNFTLNSFFLDHFFPCGVMGRVLEPILRADGRRQGIAMDESPAHNRALFDLFGVWYLAHGYLGSTLKVYLPLSCHQPTFNRDLDQNPSAFQPSTLDWATAALSIILSDFNLNKNTPIELSACAMATYLQESDTEPQCGCKTIAQYHTVVRPIYL